MFENSIKFTATKLAFILISCLLCTLISCKDASAKNTPHSLEENSSNASAKNTPQSLEENSSNASAKNTPHKLEEKNNIGEKGADSAFEKTAPNASNKISSSETKSLSKQDQEPTKLTADNVIDFFYNYQEGLKETGVRLTTSFGTIEIELYDNVPYHKANFIFLAKQGYFNGTYFHRVVKDFIIQGGNADNEVTAQKRRDIGRYLLPPDTKKGHKHHRGVISMPSSENDNPHKLASPYEFFIVVAKPGSYHLDGDYTPFGEVTSGMEVVDLINQQPVEAGDWPVQNIYIFEATAY